MPPTVESLRGLRWRLRQHEIATCNATANGAAPPVVNWIGGSCTQAAESLAPLSDLAGMLAAIEAARASTPLEREYRMHPDDYAELKRSESFKSRTPLDSQPLAGLSIVLDSQAPRLPRKP